MTDLFPQAPYLDINDVYSDTYRNIAKISTTISFILSMAIQPIYIYVIIKRSPKTMTVFKRLLLCYILCTIMFEIGIILLKPLLLLPLFVVYPVGLLHPMNSKMILLFVFLTMFSISSASDFLVTILAQRYFMLTKYNSNSWIPNIFYIFLVVSNLLLILSFFGCFISVTITDEEAASFLSTHLSHSQPLTSPQIIVLVADYHNIARLKLGLIFAAIFVFTRFLCFCFFLYRNITLPKQLGISLSFQNQKHHHMLIRAVCAQLFGIFIFVIFPVLIIFVYLLFPTLPNAHKVWVIVLCYVNHFVIYDTVITIICIRPYRTFFKYLLCKCHFIRPSVVTVFSSTRTRT